MTNTRIKVLRPTDPVKAIARALEITKLPRALQEEAFDRMLEEQTYTFAGFWSSEDPKNLYDAEGKVIGRLLPGDSMATENVKVVQH